MGLQSEQSLTREEATRLYIANQAFMPVSEIARRAGVSRQTLHNWAQMALKRIEKAPAPDTSTGPTTHSEESATVGTVNAIVPDGLHDNATEVQ